MDTLVKYKQGLISLFSAHQASLFIPTADSGRKDTNKFSLQRTIATFI